MLIEALCPLHIRRSDGDLHLLPGQTVELDPEEAQKLLTKAHSKVRVVAKEEIVIEPALRPDGHPLSPIFWERADGSIVGAAHPEFFARISRGNRDEDFWIVVQDEDETVWVRSDRLRSKQDCQRQVPHSIITRVTEPSDAQPNQLGRTRERRG